MDENASLEDARRRIEATDLVPSRMALLQGIDGKFKRLALQGVSTLGALRRELKSAKRLDTLARSSEIEAQYLVLLRREIEGWFPEPPKLRAFDWLPDEDIARLERRGIRDGAALNEAAGSAADIGGLAAALGVENRSLEALLRLADLTRVQWVSPTTARMLMETGCDSAEKLARADAEALCKALEDANQGGRYFKGKIGLRDVKRLVMAASYVQKGA